MMGIGQLLVEQGLVSANELEVATARHESTGVPLVRCLVDLRVASEAQIVSLIAEHMGLPFADCSPGKIDPNAAVLLTEKTAIELMALPVAFGQDNDLIVAISDPANTAALDRVAAVTGMEVTPALAAKTDLVASIRNMADGAAESLNGVPDYEGDHGGDKGASGTDDTLVAYERESRMELNEALVEMTKRGGSDLHLTVGLPPMIRVHGDLQPMEDFPELQHDDIQQMIYGILTQRQREQFENDLELDCSHSVAGLARYRVNVFRQRDSIGSVMRIIPYEIKSIDELGIPSQVTNFAYLPRGFVLVTGPTGSGKSTTLAGLIDVINRERACHIMTVEDPIEFLHTHKRSVINQRELGADTRTFTSALKHVLRQDPDVILVGEMRDLETIQVALTAAETGHLVFGTLHTQDAPQTVDRVIDVFPPHQQEQIRVMLGGALQGVVCQQLLKTTDGKGRAAACEVMIATPAIKNLIREGKTHQMYSSIQAGKQFGMVTMDQSLADMVLKGKVTYDAALEKCNNVPDFNRLCGRA